MHLLVLEMGTQKERLDDNVQTIRRRFQVFQESSLPVVEYYESLDKVRKVTTFRIGMPSAVCLMPQLIISLSLLTSVGWFNYYPLSNAGPQINGIRSIEDVFNSIRPLFKPFIYVS